MSEKLQPNPLLDEPGMSHEQQQEMIALREDLRGKEEYAQLQSQQESELVQQQRTQKPWDKHKVGPAMMLDQGMRSFWADRKAERASKRDAKFYKNNEDAIQVQAVKDADAEGYNTSFGPEDPVSESKKAA